MRGHYAAPGLDAVGRYSAALAEYAAARTAERNAWHWTGAGLALAAHAPAARERAARAFASLEAARAACVAAGGDAPGRSFFLGH